MYIVIIRAEHGAPFCDGEFDTSEQAIRHAQNRCRKGHSATVFGPGESIVWESD